MLQTVLGLNAAQIASAGHVVCALVATNSITQGEQPGALWPALWKLNIRIHFAHRTFRWRNEGAGMAAVHCVIIGFGLMDVSDYTIFEYDDIRGEPHAVPAQRINPYLVDAPQIALSSRTEPICPVPNILFGSKPTDGGHLIFSAEAKDDFLQKEPNSAPYIRQYFSADDFINGIPRYCLWLKGCPPQVLSKMPRVLEHIADQRVPLTLGGIAGRWQRPNWPPTSPFRPRY